MVYSNKCVESIALIWQGGSGGLFNKRDQNVCVIFFPNYLVSVFLQAL